MLLHCQRSNMCVPPFKSVVNLRGEDHSNASPTIVNDFLTCFSRPEEGGRISMSQPEPGTVHTPTSSQDAANSTVQMFSYSQPTHPDAMLLGSQHTGTQGSSQVSTPTPRGHLRSVHRHPGVLSSAPAPRGHLRSVHRHPGVLSSAPAPRGPVRLVQTGQIISGNTATKKQDALFCMCRKKPMSEKRI